jgi:Asp-tRNA(Asn)/Glu-tRNA(Gln) amidotransferase A subunit family amidase
MDKLGPMCRSAEDCALVLNAIMGADGRDATAVDAAFHWPPGLDVAKLRVGYVKAAFERRGGDNDQHVKALDDLRALGVNPTPVEFPDFPTSAMMFILTVEAAAAFDDLTRSNRDDELVRQAGWPRTFRQARLVPAVEYLQANRVRRLMMEAMGKLMAQYDAVVTPTNHELLLGNLTGHPLVAVPSGLRDGDRPTSISFVGPLYGEDKMLALAKAYQDAKGHHLHYPPIDTWLNR